jgi:SAM-dependent methyltransferase
MMEISKLEGYFPFTPVGIASRHINKNVRTILDVGCGTGEPMIYINRKQKYVTTGLDVFPEYINICKKKQSHDNYIVGDALTAKIERHFDLVLCSRVLEHFTREQGIELINKMENIANVQVIIVTPVGDFKQSEFDGNKYQEHKYIWSDLELQRMGYRTYLNGFKSKLTDKADNITPFQTSLAVLRYGLWGIFGWMPEIMPSLAANMVAIKEL